MTDEPVNKRGKHNVSRPPPKPDHFANFATFAQRELIDVAEHAYQKREYYEKVRVHTLSRGHDAV